MATECRIVRPYALCCRVVVFIVCNRVAGFIGRDFNAFHADITAVEAVFFTKFEGYRLGKHADDRTLLLERFNRIDKAIVHHDSLRIVVVLRTILHRKDVQIFATVHNPAQFTAFFAHHIALHMAEIVATHVARQRSGRRAYQININVGSRSFAAGINANRARSAGFFSPIKFRNVRHDDVAGIVGANTGTFVRRRKRSYHSRLIPNFDLACRTVLDVEFPVSIAALTRIGTGSSRVCFPIAHQCVTLRACHIRQSKRKRECKE